MLYNNTNTREAASCSVRRTMDFSSFQPTAPLSTLLPPTVGVMSLRPHVCIIIPSVTFHRHGEMEIREVCLSFSRFIESTVKHHNELQFKNKKGQFT